MIKNIFLSFKDNFKEKTSNPFIATYILIWLVRNWVLWYSVISFDKEATLESRIKYIQDYYQGTPYMHSILSNIWITFVSLILIYLILNLSRYIVNLFEKRLKPFVYKISDSQSIVLKEVYESVRNERDDLQNRLGIERDSKFKLESRIKALEAEILEREIVVAESEGEDSLHDNEEMKQIYKRLESEKLTDDFKAIVIHIKKGGQVQNNYPSLDRYIELDLLGTSLNQYGGANRYTITSIGEKLFKYISLQNK